MLKRPRIIPTLLIREQNLVKTKKFSDERYLGDPINAVRIFNEEGVDELCILDIGAAKERTVPDMDFLYQLATEAFMPMSYGGGVTSIDQMRDIFRAGYEKIVINTFSLENPQLISKAVEEFGSQSIVVAIDYKKKLIHGYQVMIQGGTIQGNVSPVDRAIEAEKLGAGEILLYSIDDDGQMGGYNYKLIDSVASATSIPVIACGGAGNLKDIYDLFHQTKAAAAAAGSLFVYFGKKQAVLINYPDEKDLIDCGIYYEE